ncbi:ENR1 protein, partial [Caloenas nicobarica]|nr:ENR1 protein [Caloenas nicobarica]
TDNCRVCFVNETADNPYRDVNDLKTFWEDPGQNDSVRSAPDGLFWICGRKAYSKLPRDWKGTCSIGIIQPAFFLLPKEKGNKILGKPL